MLPGPRLFRSRWAALLWAAGIVWAAADLADALPGERHRTDGPAHATAAATGDDIGPPDNEDVAAAIAALR